MLPRTFIVTSGTFEQRETLIAGHFNSREMPFEFFRGFDGRKLGLKPLIYHSPGRRVTQRQIGALLSHAALWRTLLHLPEEEFLVFEDDAFVPFFFEEKLAGLKENLPSDWEFVYLYHTGGMEIKSVAPGVSKWESPLATTAYLIRKSALQKLIDSCQSVFSEVDIQLVAGALDNLNCYCANPPIVITQDFPSTTGPKRVKYTSPWGEFVLRKYRERAQSAYSGIPLTEDQEPLPKPYVIKKKISGARFDFIVGNKNGKSWYDIRGAGDIQKERWTEIEQIKKLINPGDIVFDCGAHQGFYSLAFSKFVGRNGKVVAFEPFPQNTDLITFNAQINEAQNIIIIAAAVSDSTGVTEMSIGGARIEAGGFVVPRTNLDSINVRPNFIKIDVEGAEAAVLRGATKTLQSIPNLAIEIHTPMIGKAGVEEVLSLIDFSKYECTYALNGEFLPWSPGVEIGTLTTLYCKRR